ncbi:glycine betaine ABC transporter substrate-binding protein [Pygmaiobacter massiliensis]|uniref:glycine betaine ABC transporter substrate-binding protein n=1 Tax=Pygmaiobacter massiliensis TaxID=1917873 RepID=UPI000C7D69FB|nr:glycine betaine ABC transporter substrate-binding protein [Pygmaiobacter massiliensis]MDY4785248.1 glycine betaine ABC transporter substrate-binding protein [Pygmaiobacter massiliensis]
MKRWIALLLCLLLCLGLFAGCGSKKQDTIVFADAGWDSSKFHNAVAGLIAESVYGYTWSETTGSSTVLLEGMKKGEIDVFMEMWTDNIASYDEDIANGRIQEMGTNFDDNMQGFYVPRYVIEGDPERGIEPMAPELRNVADLANYASLFKDEEQPSKGRIYGAIPGWEIDNVMYKKYQHYGLDKNFVYFRPGSDASLSAAITSAYEKGEPIVAYYWEPTWLMGKYDFVLLQDAPYDPVGFAEGKTACPAVNVTISTSNAFAEKNPEFCQFLSKYRTSSALTSEALAYMQDTGANYVDTAKWFLGEHPELLEQWLAPDDVEKVQAAINGNAVADKNNWFLNFPFTLNIDLEAIDNAVRDFSVRTSGFFGSIKAGLTALIGGIESLLNLLPWWLLLALVFLGGWKLCGSVRTGIVYAVLLFVVGLFGLWSLMNETLAIVLASVVISLLLGLPIGILISSSRRANNIMRPILDTMQTMPVFVYLIPAILFFGLGKAPAVIATTIYAIVPVIRLTSHGIQQVDAEVVEAARSFGSTRWQTLYKVQIPQALPTIMTGVNQTLMMAMAMVVTCSMIGASGLGMEVLVSVNRIEIGRGIIAGTAVVIVAIVMDRITQGLAKRSEEKNNSN